MKKDDAIGVGVIFLFGAATCYFSLRMSIGTFRAAGSGLFPLGLGILLMGLSMILVAKSLVKSKATGQKKPDREEPRADRQVLLFMGAIVLATVFFNKLGYPLAAFLLLFALLRILGVRRLAYNFSLSFLTAAGAYVLFVLWLQIPLPKGWIGI